jgi:DNA invertase Pin-like site-specific DNA recombinase
MTEIVGYRRVSSTQQNLDRQDLPDVTGRIFEEKISAKSKDRPQLQEMLKYIRGADEVHVHSIDRLARNLRDLEDIVNAIITKDASIRFIKEGLHFKPGVDDPFQQLMLQMLGSFAQFERSLMKARQQEGIEKAKAQGKFKGRGAVINEELVTDLLAYDVPARDVCRWLGIGISSVYRIAEKRGGKPELHSKMTPDEIMDWWSHVREHRLYDDIDDYQPRDIDIAEFAIELLRSHHGDEFFTPENNDELNCYIQLTRHFFEDPIWAEQTFERYEDRHRTAMGLIYTRKAPDGSMDEERLGYLKHIGLSPSEAADRMGVDAWFIEAVWDSSFIKKPSWVEG